MNKLQLRKIILSAGCLFLLVVAIIQTIVLSKDSVKVIKTDKKIDEISVFLPEENYTLRLDGEDWLVGKNNYKVNQNSADDMLNALKKIQVLEKIGSAKSEDSISRYELAEGKVITVQAKAGGNAVRTLKIGKASSTNSQVYAIVDDSSDIVLLSGNLRYTYDKKMQDLRDKTVLNINTDEITSISINPADGKNWKLSVSGQGEDAEWTLSGADISVDSQKAASWFSSFSYFAAVVWLEEIPECEKLLTAEITTSSKKINFELFCLKDASDENKKTYYATCSETPYKFELAEYAALRFLKTPDFFEK